MNINASKNETENLFRNQFLSTKSWRVNGITERRIEYDKHRRAHEKKKISNGEPKLDQGDKLCPTSKHKIRKHISAVKPMDTLMGMNRESKKDERLNLDELALDKVYLKRMLLDEHVRMLYLRSGKMNQKILREKPHLRLLLEYVMHKVSNRSSKLRNNLRHEINFLGNRYQVNKQLQFQQTLQSLNLDEIYKKHVEDAKQEIIHYGEIMNELIGIWRLYYYRLYEKTAKDAELLTGMWRQKELEFIKSLSNKNAELQTEKQELLKERDKDHPTSPSQMPEKDEGSHA